MIFYYYITLQLEFITKFQLTCLFINKKSLIFSYVTYQNSKSYIEFSQIICIVNPLSIFTSAENSTWLCHIILFLHTST